MRRLGRRRGRLPPRRRGDARQLGPVEILVNNAGDAVPPTAPPGRSSRPNWRLKLAVNLDAPFYLTRLVLPEMLRRGHGRASSTSRRPRASWPGADMTTFVASKHGLVGLTRAVAIDAGKGGVTCNAICPGWVAPASPRTPRRSGPSARATYPAGRVVTIAEVASLVAYLASDAAAGISGEAIRVALGSTW